MRTPTKLKIIVPWQYYNVGDVIEPTAILRDWLIQNGFAEILKEKKKRD